MSELKSVIFGGLALLAGIPVIGIITWILWTYLWTNVLIWIVLAYSVRNYD